MHYLPLNCTFKNAQLYVMRLSPQLKKKTDHRGEGAALAFLYFPGGQVQPRLM